MFISGQGSTEPKKIGHIQYENVLSSNHLLEASKYQTPWVGSPIMGIWPEPTCRGVNPNMYRAKKNHC